LSKPAQWHLLSFCPNFSTLDLILLTLVHCFDIWFVFTDIAVIPVADGLSRYILQFAILNIIGAIYSPFFLVCLFFTFTRLGWLGSYIVGTTSDAILRGIIGFGIVLVQGIIVGMGLLPPK
jgi:hypothetical protein